MSSRFIAALGGCLTAFLLVSASPAAQSAVNYAEYSWNMSGVSPLSDSDSIQTSPGDALLGDDKSYSSGASHGEMHCRAWGYAGGLAGGCSMDVAAAPGTSGPQGGHVFTKSRTSSILTFDASNDPNGSGPDLKLVTLEFFLHGTLAGKPAENPVVSQSQFNAEASWGAVVDDVLAVSVSGQIDSAPGSPIPINPLETGTKYLVVDLANGQSRTLVQEMVTRLTAIAWPGHSASASVNLLSTATFMGVASVTNSQGVPVTNYTLTDEFGNDWTQPLGTKRWSDLGYGLAGEQGLPSLMATGTLMANSTGDILLVNAQPSAPAVLFIGFAASPTPFKGGQLVPVPPQITIFLVTSPGGGILLGFTWPPGVPSGLGIHFQYGILDATAVSGVALSNALKATPP